MPTLSSTFRFAAQASLPKNAIALIHDLEGFSRFYNQPDVQDYVPLFLNRVSTAVSVALFGGTSTWHKEDKLGELEFQVAHEKFMGDGALYILMPPKGSNDFGAEHLRILCNRLWNLKDRFGTVADAALDEVPVAEVPRRIRFGVARGSVYELKKPGSKTREYIGFCINLASRLQSYCSHLGFIASARLKIPDAVLKKGDYRRVVATSLKGFPNELVIVDSSEYSGLEDGVRTALFREVDQA